MTSAASNESSREQLAPGAEEELANFLHHSQSWICKVKSLMLKVSSADEAEVCGALRENALLGIE